MRASRNLRTKIAIASFAAITSVSMAVPALASADAVGELLNNLGLGGVSGQSAGAGSGGGGGTKAGTPPNYVPPLHGTNPHGQGDAATVSLAPVDANPSTGVVTQPETIIVGRSKGEQNPDGTYHGHVTIASLGGNELLGVNTTQGQTASGPLEPLQTMLLDAICTGTGQICLTLLTANSSTNASGSSNDFSVATARLGPEVGPLINAQAVQSSGDISNDATCQTATGTSRVLGTQVLAGAITAGLSESSSQSTACNNGTAPTVTQNSRVLALQGAGQQIPAQGCENGTPDTNFVPLNPLIATVCNADDVNAGQTSVPYGVREALTVFALVAAVPTVKATTAAAESHVVAPPRITPPPPPPPPPGLCPGPNCPNNNNGDGGPGDNDRDDGGDGVPTAADATVGDGSLAFTGADLIWLAMLGIGLVGAGLGMYATVSGSRRPRLQA